MANKDPLMCPITGKPCLIPKIIQVTDVEKGKASTMKLCHSCGQDFMKKNDDLEKKVKGNFDEFIDKAKLKKSPEAMKAFGGIMEFLDNIIASAESESDGEKTPKITQASKLPIEDACPKCGCTLKEIIKTERLGCEGCYTHFKNPLRGVIRSVQGNALKHVGKVPKKWKERQDAKHTVEKLESKLHDAIKEEDYEKASQIRDILKDFKE